MSLSQGSNSMSVLSIRDGSTRRIDVGSRIVTISSLSVTSSRRRTVLNVVPNAFPATRLSATRDVGDSSVVEYVQVYEYSSSRKPGASP
jgi:hypothetical protein